MLECSSGIDWRNIGVLEKKITRNARIGRKFHLVELAIKKQNTKIDCLVSYVSIDEAGYTTISSVTVYIYFLTRYSTSEIITTPQIHYANTYSQKNGAFLKVIKVISYSTAD